MAAALAGLEAYQRAERRPPPPAPPAIAEAGRARLLDYGGPKSRGAPAVVFVPSLINPPTILDLAEDNSMLRWLATQGLRPLLVDWGEPEEKDADLGIAGHVEQLLLPLLDRFGERAHLAGYCLGGTMAAAAAGPADARSLTLIAAPWRFSGFPDESRAGLAEIWRAAEPTARALAALPMEVLQSAFWRLDPARTVGKFEKFGRLDPASDAARAFVALEDWANDGPPLTYGAARELIEDLFGGDATGTGEWAVAGARVDPDALSCPVLDIVSTSDRIVPAATAARSGESRELALGHVGMVVGGRAQSMLWEPLRDWLRERSGEA
ncbi:MAG: alpha/beta hydrolase [Parasphingopyxis sp.]|nr:alpha/beta fold hydrolase [Sphingomonadales bacterium]